MFRCTTPSPKQTSQPKETKSEALVEAGDKTLAEKTVLSRKVQKFYEDYPCGGLWLKGDSRHELLPWWEEILEYREWSGHMVLDAGCGSGLDMSGYLKQGATVVGIDLAHTPLSIASQHLRNMGLLKNASLIQCSLHCLPFREGVFDLIYSVGVLHHVPNAGGAVAEMRRVLRRGGKVIVPLYHKASLATIFTKMNRVLYSLVGPRLEALYTLFLGRRPNPAEKAALMEMWKHPLITYFTKSSSRILFEGYGFRHIETACYDSLYPLSRLASTLTNGAFLADKFGRFLVVKSLKLPLEPEKRLECSSRY